MNKGFSLVELIVVIAIMAILVGVAVPVYTSYIGKANIGVDQQNVDNLVHACEIVEIEYGVKVTYTFEDNKITAAVTTDDKSTNDEDATKQLKAILGDNGLTVTLEGTYTDADDFKSKTELDITFTPAGE